MSHWEEFAADHAVDWFVEKLLAAIELETNHSKDVAHIPGLVRALSIVKEVWQQ